MTHPSRTTLLIAALGGQGGGVLTGWIVEAARAEGYVAQATSTPGVSQRTGATTYYVEIAARNPAGNAPVLGLSPMPGLVDVLVCAELLEAARMLERGFCTPARTTVVASTHRVYTTREKMSAGDARYDADRIVHALETLSSRAAVRCRFRGRRAKRRSALRRRA
jgi:indolepyruvate ferredoxin oxidoreductase, beta subunit